MNVRPLFFQKSLLPARDVKISLPEWEISEGVKAFFTIVLVLALALGVVVATPSVATNVFLKGYIWWNGIHVVENASQSVCPNCRSGEGVCHCFAWHNDKNSKE